MGNQDNSIQREDNISNDSQLSEGSNNQQHNKKPKWLNKKNITIILTLLVVIIVGIFFFIRSSNAYGEKTPEEVSQKFLDAINKEDYLKASDYVYYACSEKREEVRKELQEEVKKEDKSKMHISKAIYRNMYFFSKDLEIDRIVEENGEEPYALLKEKPDSNRNRQSKRLLLKKVKNRWYIDLKYS